MYAYLYSCMYHFSAPLSEYTNGLIDQWVGVADTEVTIWAELVRVICLTPRHLKPGSLCFSIRQETNEDWKQVRIKLSTAMPKVRSDCC